MHAGEFFKRFAEHQEIGRDLTDTHLSVFYDNGGEVGLWRMERSTTIGQGEVLGEEDAGNARHWCKQSARDAGYGRSR